MNATAETSRRPGTRRCGRAPAYRSEWAAISAAATLRWTGLPATHPTHCPHCQMWHLTVLEPR